MRLTHMAARRIVLGSSRRGSQAAWQRDQQKWEPVLRPIALKNMNWRMNLSPNRSHPRVKPEGMLWRFMR
jgi:hypothetical protein